MPGPYSVYEHVFPDGKRYIGITRQDPKQRWQNGRGYGYSSKVHDAIEKYGWDNIEHNVLSTNLSRYEAQKQEKKLIVEFNSIENGYNTRTGGETGATFYSSYVVKMLQLSRRTPFQNKGLCGILEEYADDEWNAINVNFLDRVIASKSLIDKFNGDPYTLIDAWEYYMKIGLHGDDMLAAKPYEEARNEHIIKMMKGMNS